MLETAEIPRICSVSVSSGKPAEHIAQVWNAERDGVEVDEVMAASARFPIGLRQHKAIFLRVSP